MDNFFDNLLLGDSVAIQLGDNTTTQNDAAAVVDDDVWTHQHENEYQALKFGHKKIKKVALDRETRSRRELLKHARILHNEIEKEKKTPAHNLYIPSLSQSRNKDNMVKDRNIVIGSAETNDQSDEEEEEVVNKLVFLADNSSVTIELTAEQAAARKKYLDEQVELQRSAIKAHALQRERRARKLREEKLEKERKQRQIEHEKRQKALFKNKPRKPKNPKTIIFIPKHREIVNHQDDRTEDRTATSARATPASSKNTRISKPKTCKHRPSHQSKTIPASKQFSTFDFPSLRLDLKHNNPESETRRLLDRSDMQIKSLNERRAKIFAAYNQAKEGRSLTARSIQDKHQARTDAMALASADDMALDVPRSLFELNREYKEKRCRS